MTTVRLPAAFRRRASRTAGRVTHRLAAQAVVLCLLAALLLPLTAQGVSANPCPEGQVLGPDVEVVNEDGSVTIEPGQCVPVEAEDPAAPEEPPADGGEQFTDPAADPNLPEPPPSPTPEEPPIEPTEKPVGSSISIVKRGCPVGYDAYAADFLALDADCTEAMVGIGFAVSDGSGPIAQGSTDGGGVVEFVDLPAGATSVAEQIPAGFGEPVVYCRSITIVNGAEVPSPLAQLSASGGLIQYQLNAAESLFCDWYNVPAIEPAADSGEVVVSKYVCPAGYDPTGLPWEEIYLDCTDNVDGITFDLNVAGVDFGAQVTGQGQALAGAVSWIDVPAGDLTLTEALPPGYADPLVYCFSDHWGNTVAAIQQMGSTIESTLPAGGYLGCLWFNIPLNDGLAGEPGDVTITKYECPVNYNAENTPIDDLLAACNEPMADVTFFAGAAGIPSVEKTTGADGVVAFEDLPIGQIGITERAPDGYGKPVVYCTSYLLAEGGPIVTGPTKQNVLVGADNPVYLIRYDLKEGESLTCTWFNTRFDGGTVTIEKYECPAGYTSSDFGILTQICGKRMADVPFHVLAGDAEIAQGATDANGVIEFTNLPYGPLSIVEEVPNGYGEPIVFCRYLAPTVTDPAQQTVQDGNWIPFQLTDDMSVATCYWFNTPEYGTITIEKYTCPAGYDYLAWGADPAADCPTKTDGITFTLESATDPNVQVVQGTSGETYPGGVTFAGLGPDTYTVTELVPDGIAAVFVLDCTGSSIPQIQSVPLSYGTELTIALAAGDDIVCRWYNVPTEPGKGEVEVIKYICTTQTFVSDSYCQRYEGGQTFTLTGVAGGGAGSSYDGTTDVTGELTFPGLYPGTYELDEVGATWCAARADYTDAQGYLEVEAGRTTTVEVFNCGGEKEKDPPTKYPNTGVGPQAVTGAVAAAPVSPTTPVEAGSSLSGWQRVLARIGLAFGQGERPVAIRVERADVDAEIEVLEIVNGEMQAPTGAEQVAWYKDTARLGTGGNVILAGHLNYWGVPEGVFYALGDLKEGDVIEVEGESGIVYRYRVTAVGLADATAAPAEEIVGQTDAASLTLITCGGEWDAARGEYLSRTVVQAELIVE